MKSSVETSKTHSFSNCYNNFIKRQKKDFKQYKQVYFMLIPVILFYILFCYTPMYGVIIAFKDFRPGKGIMGSDWVGLQHFVDFFSSIYFGRILKNTLTISISTLVFSFPAPIILALLINELRSKKYARVVQTITYLPHFISTVVICGMIVNFVSTEGVITSILGHFGVERQNLLQNANMFVPIYVISGIWQGVGWGSIIYLSALQGISQELYEAAVIDGANRWQQTLHVTIPGIVPTIITLLILNMGSLLNVGFEKIILLYNDAILETSDVISTFVYRKGILNQSWSYSTAVGLFNSVINFILLITSNQISKKVNNTSLW